MNLRVSRYQLLLGILLLTICLVGRGALPHLSVRPSSGKPKPHRVAVLNQQQSLKAGSEQIKKVASDCPALLTSITTFAPVSGALLLRTPLAPTAIVSLCRTLSLSPRAPPAA